MQAAELFFLYLMLQGAAIHAKLQTVNLFVPKGDEFVLSCWSKETHNSSVTLVKRNNGNDGNILFQTRPKNWCEVPKTYCSITRFPGTDYFQYTVLSANFTDAGIYHCTFEFNQHVFRKYKVFIHGAATSESDQSTTNEVKIICRCCIALPSNDDMAEIEWVLSVSSKSFGSVGMGASGMPLHFEKTFMVELERSDNTVAQCDLMYQGYRIAYHRQTLEFGGNTSTSALIDDVDDTTTTKPGKAPRETSHPSVIAQMVSILISLGLILVLYIMYKVARACIMCCKKEHELPAKVENETADPDSTVGLLDITPGPCVTVRVDTSTLSLNNTGDDDKNITSESKGSILREDKKSIDVPVKYTVV